MGTQQQKRVDPPRRVRDGGAPDDGATPPTPPAAPASPTVEVPDLDTTPDVDDGAGAGPGIGYTAVWAHLAVTVDPDQAESRTVDGVHELYLTVTGPGGDRDVPLLGRQVTLIAGETLPAAAVPGLGALLHTFGAVHAVPIPARP